MSFHVRRKDREIVDLAVLKHVLKTTNYVTIALCKDNEPYLVSISHGYDEANNCIYFHCAPEGKKIEYIKANNKVWGQTMLDYGITDDCDYAYTSIQFQGTLALIEDLTEKTYAMQILVRQLSKDPETKLAKIKPEKLAKTTMGKININYLSGKQHKDPKVKNTFF